MLTYEDITVGFGTSGKQTGVFKICCPLHKGIRRIIGCERQTQPEYQRMIFLFIYCTIYVMLYIYRYVDGVEIRYFLVVHLYGDGQRDTVSKADWEVGAFYSDFIFAIHTSL